MHRCIPSLYHRAEQTAHTLSLSAFFLSPTIFLHHSLLSAPRDHSLQLPRCENLPVFCCWTCKPDWTKSNSAGLRQRAALHTKVDIKGADIWRCYRWWINSKKVHQVLRGPCGFSLFMSIKHLWEWWYLVRLITGLQPTVHFSRI